jgi:uncharacterized protein YjbJ (UPF0337 family)
LNKDQLKGRGKQAAGKLKEVTGKVTGNKRTAADGRVDQALGKAQEVLGDAKAGAKQIVRKVK